MKKMKENVSMPAIQILPSLDEYPRVFLPNRVWQGPQAQQHHAGIPNDPRSWRAQNTSYQASDFSQKAPVNPLLETFGSRKIR